MAIKIPERLLDEFCPAPATPAKTTGVGPLFLTPVIWFSIFHAEYGRQAVRWLEVERKGGGMLYLCYICAIFKHSIIDNRKII